MACRLAVQVLGVFRVSLDGAAVADAAWRRASAKALVKLLALAPGHRLHREQVYESLWEGIDEAAAAPRFRKALYFARRAMASEHVVVRDAMVGLEAVELWVDVDVFEAAVDRGEMAAAITLYAGDLLPEDRFASWTEPRREQLRVRYGRVLLARARELNALGEWDASAELLERLIALDPIHEQAHAELMRVLAQSGRRGLAERIYQQLVARLQAELGVAPARAVQQAREDILTAPVEQARSRSGWPEPVSPLLQERRLVTVLAVGCRPTAVSAAAAELRSAARGALVWEQADALLAVFGARTVGENDTAAALYSALALIQRLPGRLQIGVETGDAVIDTKPAGAIVGEPVDAAIRLRDAARPGTVLTGPVAYGMAREWFTFGRVGSGVLQTRQLRAAVRTPRRPRPPRTRFVGRRTELNTLVSLCAQTARDGLPRLVTVVGVAGIGKSRLVAETVSRVPAGTTVLCGRCPPRGLTGNYRSPTSRYTADAETVLAELLQAAAGQQADADNSRFGLREGLGRLLDPLALPPAVQHTTAAALCLSAGITVGDDNVLDGLRPGEVAEEIAHAWPRFATACARAGPVLFVVEDLHWATPRLLPLLERIVGRCGAPVVLLGTARPELLEAHPGYGSRGEGSTLITLPALTETDSRQLLADLTASPTRRIGDELAVEVLARAEGNPFFLEELIAHLGDEPAEPSAARLPPTLRAVLSARVDALPPLQRRVLQEASVVGRAFWRGPVERGLGLTDVTGPLVALEVRGLITAQAGTRLTGHAQYTFKHALVREVAYASLTRTRRAHAHASVGAWLENLTLEHVDDLAELLAYHYGQAADPRDAQQVWHDPVDRERVRSRAWRYLCTAGCRARARSALDHAIDLHRAAVELARTPGERLVALEALGDDHAHAYQGASSGSYLHEALDIARADPAGAADRARLCWKLAWQMAMNPGAFRGSLDPARAEGLVAEGLSVAPDDRSRARLLVTHAGCARLWKGSEPFGQGERPDPTPIDDRIRAAEQAIVIATAHGDQELIRAAHAALIVLYSVAGRYDELLDLAQRQLDGLDTVRSRLEQADVLRVAAVLTGAVAGRFAESLDYAQRSRSLCGTAHPHQLMHATAPALAALLHLGRFDELDQLAAEHVHALAREPALGCQFVRDGPLIAATALARRGQLARAADLAALVADARGHNAEASPYQARYATARGDPATARRISQTQADRSALNGPQHALALIEALEAQQDWDAVEAVLPMVRAQRAGNALLEPFCDRAEGLAHAAHGRRQAAQDCLDRALNRFEHMVAVSEAGNTRVIARQLS